MDTLLPVLLRRAVGQVRYLRPVPARRASGLVAEVYRQLEDEFGMLAPPVALHAQLPELLAASWLMLRESLVATGPLSRYQRELVAVAVSRANACPYCVTVHGLAESALASTAMPTDDLPTGDLPTSAGLAEWVASSLRRDTARRLPPPTGSGSQLLGVATTFHYLNRMVNVFLPESPLPTVLSGPGGGMVQRLLAGRAGRPHPAGTALELLPAGPRRHPDPVVEAFSRAEGAVRRAVDRWLTPGLAGLLPAVLADWDGSPPALTDTRLADALDTLPADERPAARLALLTAISSYRVTPVVVEEFRRWQPADEALLAIAAWASLLAARELGSWPAADGFGSDSPSNVRGDCG
jgi:alkylhydroperoxidase/carboxymuconolactone decarboxylase family protein YurZ